MATGKAPISGALAIAAGLWAVTIAIIEVTNGNSWFSATSSFGLFVILVVAWRGMKKQDQHYQERMERLDRRLGSD